jgi:hypothetical protein
MAKTKLMKDLFKTIQQVARELQIHQMTVRKVIKLDMKAKSHAQVQKLLITQISKENHF